MSKAGYRSLNVWQRSMKVSASVLKITAAFPKVHQFGIVQQMQRAAISIPSNIAEGYNRNSRKEYVYFLGVALGSTGELETQCTLAVMANIVPEKEVAPVMLELNEIGKMIRGMIRTLSKS